jgi:hypothetical protein
VLERSRARLLENLPLLKGCTSFDELHELVDRLIRPIAGVGELAVYDTTLRIGARFGLAPAKVYLHAGTRIGARNLGLDARNGELEIADLPPELQTLAAHELEDVLCIYKDDFGKQAAVGTTEDITGVSCEPREQSPPSGCYPSTHFQAAATRTRSEQPIPSDGGCSLPGEAAYGSCPVA